MRTCRVIASVVVACCLLAPTISHADLVEDEAAIRKNDEAYVKAYNKGDAKALASLWSAEAVYVDPETGDEAVGREEIEQHFAEAFDAVKDAKLEIDVSSIKFLSPSVAVENGTARIVSPKEELMESTYSALFIKHEGKWLIDRVTEQDSQIQIDYPPSNYEHLKELEWMIGSWVDSDEDNDTTIQTDCMWTKNKNFITRSFAVVIGGEVDMSGMQIIGWDAASKRIRSWVFDSDGGFYEGKWTRKGDRWVVQQTGVVPDGGKAAEVNLIKQVDDNSFTWRSVQRSIDGDILPDVAEVTVVRKPAD